MEEQENFKLYLTTHLILEKYKDDYNKYVTNNSEKAFFKNKNLIKSFYDSDNPLKEDLILSIEEVTNLYNPLLTMLLLVAIRIENFIDIKYKLLEYLSLKKNAKELLKFNSDMSNQISTKVKEIVNLPNNIYDNFVSELKNKNLVSEKTVEEKMKEFAKSLFVVKIIQEIDQLFGNDNQQLKFDDKAFVKFENEENRVRLNDVLGIFDNRSIII